MRFSGDFQILHQSSDYDYKEKGREEKRREGMNGGRGEREGGRRKGGREGRRREEMEERTMFKILAFRCQI